MKSERKPDNYQKWIEEWADRFRHMDQEQLMKKLPELKPDGDYLTLFHFGHRYGIHRISGEIRSMDTMEEPSRNVKLNIYTLLWYCKPGAVLSGQWIPFRSLKDASPFGPAFQKSVLQVLAGTFSEHTDELCAACEKLGGQKLSLSDAGYRLAPFRCIPMQVLFWDGDDEFPAQANLLFDKNATDFIHVESVVTIASEGVARLADAAGLPLLGSPF